ncbi:MAG: uncharacterized protein QOE82_815 [Thermoanaerobaculia bacterium]|jgi:predicted metal-dependent hydrolase|nr:uncharacterized protein [Thermoanaerobaculia bacterium]
MDELTDDPRFLRGIALFNAGDYLEASDLFEELFFEGVRDEPDFLRIFLQFSVGIFHAQTGQWRPAVERIEEGLRLVASVQDDRGIDLTTLADAMRSGVTSLREKKKPVWPTVIFAGGKDLSVSRLS